VHGCEVNVHIEMTVSIGKIIMKGIHFVTCALAQYDGKNGNPAYVVYKGKVYDVSASFLWKDGNHQVLHSAGLDSTVALEQAPHGVGALERFHVVGIVHDACMPKTPSRQQ